MNFSAASPTSLRATLSCVWKGWGKGTSKRICWGGRENETDQGFWNLRSKIFYTPVTEENLAGLAALSERFAEPEVCEHVCVYRGDRIILSWHDLPSDPIYVSREIDEAALKRFCEILRCEYAAEDDQAL